MTKGRGAIAGPGRLSYLYLAVGLLACSIVAIAGEPVRGWLLVGVVSAAGGTGIIAVRRTGSPPAALLLLGTLLSVPAYVLWYPAKLQWDLQLGDPGVTDWLFLGAYAAFAVALTHLIRLRSTADQRVHMLDSLIISVGLGVLVWVVFISPYLHHEQMTVAAKTVAVSYTLVDLLLLGVVVRMLFQGQISSVGDRLLSGWVVAQLSADLLYSVTTLRGTFRLEGPAPVLYCVSFVLLGAALLHPSTLAVGRRETTAHPVSGLPRLAVLGSAALVAPSVLVVQGLRGESQDVPVVASLAAVLFGLVLLRVYLLMVDVQEHRRIQDRLQRAIDDERRQAVENQVLLTSLRERQMLAERLFRIQRKISTRAPLQDVLDAVTQGAAELLGDDVVGLRLIDEDNPKVMVMVSTVGISTELAQHLQRLPVGAGVGGRAFAEDRLCIAEDYKQSPKAIGVFIDTGLRSAMGAPVHLEGRPIGSLVVASHSAGRKYSEAEQGALIAFAEHVSLALNDARTVQAMHKALDQAVHQAMHDELTGLPNRACFYDRTEQALRSARRAGGSTAVLLFDLDRFKEINDTLGHRYGDRVLRAIGPRIAPHLREADSLARLGGDEFCVLLPGVDGVGAAIDVARRIIQALEEPFEIDEMDMVVEASCGVAVAPAHGDTADLLLQRSDIAMYVSKTSHVNVVAYEDQLDRNTPDRLAMLGDLRTAIATNQLVLHYQPVANLQTGAIESVEALVRWEHPRLGLVLPDQFIPIAEDTGLIRPLTTWVLDAALEQLRQWMAEPVAGGPELSMAVNLSTRSLLDDSIRDEVVIALERFDVPADRLVLEVTETTIMADPGKAHRVLAELATIGVRFAIDDFGTGYSSLASLKNLPVHHLKIDQSFVRHMHEDVNDATIVRSVIDLGRTLGLRTIAEGVEHQEAWTQLAALGCDAAQGYLLAKPMPPAELTAWLRERRRSHLRAVAD